MTNSSNWGLQSRSHDDCASWFDISLKYPYRGAKCYDIRRATRPTNPDHDGLAGLKDVESTEYSVCTRYSTSKWFSIWAPNKSSIFYINLLTQQSPKTLPWSSLWHFQVLTVVTRIEGKQQTEPLPVSASHWETNLKHEGGGRRIELADPAKQLGLDSPMVP